MNKFTLLNESAYIIIIHGSYINRWIMAYIYGYIVYFFKNLEYFKLIKHKKKQRY